MQKKSTEWLQIIHGTISLLEVIGKEYTGLLSALEQLKGIKHWIREVPQASPAIPWEDMQLILKHREINDVEYQILDQLFLARIELYMGYLAASRDPALQGEHIAMRLADLKQPAQV